jgi:hypothetical protein
LPGWSSSVLVAEYHGASEQIHGFTRPVRGESGGALKQLITLLDSAVLKPAEPGKRVDETV